MPKHLLERVHRLSPRARKIVGFVSAVPVGAGLAFVAGWLNWRGDTTMFAGLVSVFVLVPLILPFMLGPFHRLEPGDPGYQPRGSLWRLAPSALAPVAALVGYIVARPHTAHWGAAGCVAVYAAAGWLFLNSLVFLRQPKHETPVA